MRLRSTGSDGRFGTLVRGRNRRQYMGAVRPSSAQFGTRPGRSARDWPGLAEPHRQRPAGERDGGDER